MKFNLRVEKTVLDNGLTVLSHNMSHAPHVSMQLWYNVGSKHEQAGQKGIAHLLEHMCFKGTKKLSETDINTITTKLSGSCNAFTSYDYTGYLYDLPVQNWHYGLELLADCMHNCTFKPELFNSELSAVIQELKMYRDNYQSSSIEELFKLIFAGHPYQTSIIGTKEDLLTITPEILRDFYHTYYTPNNAILVIVGPVLHEDVITQAQKYFGHLKQKSVLHPVIAPFKQDFSAKTVTLRRDIQQPVLTYAFTVPSSTQLTDYALDSISWLMGSGRGSRLYKELVHTRKLATNIDTFVYDLFDQNIFLISVQPKSASVIPALTKHTHELFSPELTKKFTQQEHARARAKITTDFVELCEHASKIAYAIGKSYMATGEHTYLENYLAQDQKSVSARVHELVDTYFRPEFMHTSTVLALDESGKKLWLSAQKTEDVLDQQTLAGKQRTSRVEGPVYSEHVHVKKPQVFSAPHAQEHVLKNGLTILALQDSTVPTIELVLEFKADNLYEPAGLMGIHSIVSQAMTHGTKKYTAEQFADFIESRGMKLAVAPGFISLGMLSEHLEDGLHIVHEILTSPKFAPEEIQKVKAQARTDLQEYWDEPYQFCNTLIKKNMYGAHPYSKQVLGTKNTLQKITGRDIRTYFNQYFSPYGTRLALVGDFTNKNLTNILEKSLGSWTGKTVPELDYPKIKPVHAQTITHAINRDQVVLAYAGLSISRKDPEYDKLLLFDQIFGGGVLGSMSSYLFMIREQTGLFYTISGSTLAHASKQPGLAVVKTLVSLDRLAQAEKELKHCIKTAPERVTEQELEHAKNALINALPKNFETHKQTAGTLLYLKRFGLPENYFDTRVQTLQKITRADVQKAATRVLDLNKMICVKIGRV